jgi:acetyl esterase/lipase
MPVHPLIAARFPLISRISSLEESLMSPAAAQMKVAYEAPYDAYSLPDVDISSASISGPHGDIPVRLYRPLASHGQAPGLLWMHGGAFVAGDLDMPEAHVVSAELAVRGSTVVSVDYRLATDTVRYPIPLDDVHAAWGWFAEAVDDLGTDPQRLAIGGASAGANLAAAATMRVRDDSGTLPAAMLLAYPVVHFPVPALSDELAAEMRQLPRMLRFMAADIIDFTRWYLGRLTDIPTRTMPGHGNLEGMPPTRIVLSEYDDLRGSGELFEQQLREVGVAVESTVAEGMLHGHLNLMPTAQMPEIERSLDFLTAGLGPHQAS